MADEALKKKKRRLYLPLWAKLLLAVGLALAAAFAVIIMQYNGWLSFERPPELIPGDEGRLYQALKSGEPSDEDMKLEFDISREDLAELLSSTPIIDDYSAEFQYELYGDGMNDIINVKLSRSGDSWRVERLRSGEVFESVVCDGESVRVRDFGGESSYSMSEDFSLASSAGFPELDEFLSGEVDGSITLLNSESGCFYYIVYGYPELDITEHVFVSLEHALVIMAESYHGDRLVYAMRMMNLTKN